MPDANGRFRSAFFTLSVERWAAIFGQPPVPEDCDCEHYSECDESEGCVELEPEIEFAPDPSIDGAYFIPE